MTKRRIRLLVVAAVLVLILVLLAGYFFYYRNTKKLAFNLTGVGAQNAIVAPQFLFAFSGSGANRLQRPIGIAVTDRTVYVVDAVRHTIYSYSQDGKPTGSFGASDTVTPLWIAQNPKTKNLYVSDRRKRAVLMFTPEGKFLGEFKPKLPKSQLPKIPTGGVEWAPIAIAFAQDGTMYVTDFLKGNRFLIFGPDGAFKRSVGDAGMVDDALQNPKVFQFPNGLAVRGNELYVTDGNNRRVQIFDLQGNYLRLFPTAGLPRGIAPLASFPSDDATPPARMAVVDTLAQYVTIWDGQKGDKIVNFGEQGTLDGQFAYPDGVAVGARNRIYVTDTANGRVQVWGWPDQIATLPLIGPPTNLLWCCVPFLLLPLLLLTRKRRFFATADFVERMIELEDADLMPARRRQWVTVEGEYELIKQMEFKDIDFGSLFETVEVSESDARAFAEKYEVDVTSSSVLTAAQRAKVFATENLEYRRLAKTIEIDVVDSVEFGKRYAKRAATETKPTGTEQ